MEWTGIVDGLVGGEVVVWESGPVLGDGLNIGNKEWAGHRVDWVGGLGF